MTHWIRYTHDGREGFGQLDGERITVFEGELFGDPTATGETLPLAEVTVAMPCRPSKLIALWNNFHAMAEKQELTLPEAPLFFVKPASSYAASGAVIPIPEAAGRVVYEGELGIVIGKRIRDADEATAADAIFGYTCTNDVTAPSILKADASFAQWVRAKGLDGFSPFGPVIATGLDPASLTVRTLVNGRERQNYPVADMVFQPARLVSLLSQGMTLEPGDLIACGTSNGVGPIPKGGTVEVVIDGIGTLSNRFE
ncbi:fumarylacetoacetate hydrolase family protein [Methylobacterium sp. C25]|uniref:fumarylacetoacetate hydrolase family protein n=1 Tax=Methylobacterium sp. C25 TaxID=2721622 RepID=UPI001F420768|nr:fumarylacetoacetate hydrolase family protein [Methylobacterium sp. C25]MCE4223308.1 fumarylacetoacetate hydrolase family protein [Methylobacterium sp. C25]